MEFDETLEKIRSSAKKFNVERVKREDIGRVGGPARSKKRRDGSIGSFGWEGSKAGLIHPCFLELSLA